MKVLSKDDPYAAIHSKFMELAIEQAKLSIPVPSGYCVGAVLVRQDLSSSASAGSDLSAAFKVITIGYSREIPGNTHAEECCLIKLDQQKEQEQSQKNDDQENHQWIMYSTMEPCSTRLSGNRSCSDRLIASGVRRVYVGVREPDHFVQDVVGVENMVQHGIDVVHIPGFEPECLAPNAHILEAKN